jgi:hypothetical protein
VCGFSDCSEFLSLYGTFWFLKSFPLFLSCGLIFRLVMCLLLKKRDAYFLAIFLV